MNPDAIIFDLDGTLYYLTDIAAYNYEMEVIFYSEYTNMSRSDVINLFANNHIYKDIREDSESATAFFGKVGIDMHVWNQYRQNHYPVDMINTDNSVNNTIISRFKKLSKLFLLTTNSLEVVKEILDRLEIPQDAFEKIYTSDSTELKVFSKKAYIRIIEEYSGIENVLSIGDRKKTDIDTAVAEGQSGALVSGPEGVNEILKDLEAGCFPDTNNCHYRYYGSL